MAVIENLTKSGEEPQPRLTDINFSPKSWFTYDAKEVNGEIIQVVNLENAKNIALDFFEKQGVRSEQVEQAMSLADKAHKDKVRKVSGDPYFVHPLMTAIATAHVTKDSAVVAAALCHDVLEDSPRDYFGNKHFTLNVLADKLASGNEQDKAVQLVDALTSDDTYDKKKANPKSIEGSREAENQKAAALYKAINHSPEAVLIKTADYLSNITDFVNDYKRIGEEAFEPFDHDKNFYVRRFTDGIAMMYQASRHEGWEINPLMEPAIKKQLQLITMCKDKSLASLYGIWRNQMLYVQYQITHADNS